MTWGIISLAISATWLFAGTVFAELAIHHVEIGPRRAESLVPDAAAPGRMLAPQAISALDVSACGQFITVGTMAFGHDSN